MKTLLATILLALTAQVASADTLTFRVKSDYQYIVHLEFFSQTRNHVWPGNGDVYVLYDYDTYTIPIGCRSGEKICYGAWVANNRSTYWGVGSSNSNYCSTCCYTCGNYVTKTITFID